MYRKTHINMNEMKPNMADGMEWCVKTLDYYFFFLFYWLSPFIFAIT